VGRPDRTPLGQGRIPHRRVARKLALGGPPQVFHAAQRQGCLSRQGHAARTLPIKGTLWANQHVGGFQQGLLKRSRAWRQGLIQPTPPPPDTIVMASASLLRQAAKRRPG